MDLGSCLLFLLVLCVWRSDINPGNLVTGLVTPTIRISRLSPLEFTVNQGELVQLSCESTLLPTGYFLVWSKSLTHPMTIARNGTSLDPRYTVNVAVNSPPARNEMLFFSASGQDNEFYTCGITNVINGYAVLNDSLYLSVLYDPSVIYPICFPNGPFSAQEGTKINRSCTTEIGNPPVQFSGMTREWMYRTSAGHIQMRWQELTLGAADDGTVIQCRITSLPPRNDVDRSCNIGPITVTGPHTRISTTSTTSPVTDQPIPLSVSLDQDTMMDRMTSPQLPTQPANESNTNITTDQPAPSQTSRVPWIIAFAVILSLLIVSITINVFFIKTRNLNNPSQEETDQSQVEPYMELQSTRDRNTEYMKPEAMKPPMIQHTYYQADGTIEQNSKESDYEQPIRNVDTAYEEVEEPTDGEENKYRNI